MIEKDTVLILGAGASHGYGYPLGTGLKNLILQNANFPAQYFYDFFPSNFINTGTPINDIKPTFDYLFNNCKIDKDVINAFYTDFGKSSKYSIDTFLENRNEFLAIGKTLIAISIFNCEDDKVIFNDDPAKEPNWYKYLFNQMADSWNSFSDNKLSVITYNYDRSFEYFFVENLMHTFSKSFEECINKFEETVNVIHVHGKVGNYPYGRLTKPYGGNTIEPQYVDDAVKQLFIITEEAEVIKAYGAIHKILSKAENVFLLGFGFDKRNLSRLNLQSHEIKGNVFSTRMGLSDLETYQLNRQLEYKIKFSVNENYGIVDFLRREVALNGTISPSVFRYQSEMFDNTRFL